MSAVVERLIRFVRREDGPTAGEYVVMLASVAISAVGQQTNDTFSTVGDELRASAS